MTQTNARGLRVLLIAVLATLCLGMEDNDGCVASESSDAVNQSRIHTSYWLYVDAESDTTFGRAQFRLGNPLGTPLLLSEGARVSFAGRELGFDAVLDWYDAPRSGVLAGAFTYTDLDGTTFVNAAPSPAPVEVPAGFPRVVARDGASLEVAWEGLPLQAGESMAAVAAHGANRLLFKRWETRLAGATSIVLSGDELRDLPTGETVLVLRRWWETESIDGTDAGGVLRTTYSSREAAFLLE
ncbi:MAG: hypothetical protein AAGH15_15395 [Myxococcota bacterium]